MSPYFGAEVSSEITVKISGGINSIHGEYPHLVNLRYDGAFSCGGAIINSLFILTAAHCLFANDTTKYKNVDNVALLKVTAGDYNINKREKTEQERNVTNVYIHKEFRITKKSVEYDIALLVLDKPLTFGRHVNSIEYPKDVTSFSGISEVAGWGKFDRFSYPDVLQKVSVPIVDKNNCSIEYTNRNFTFADYMICAGVDNKDTCQGDSGSPLLCQIMSEPSRKVVCGIASFGEKYCSVPGLPSVFTDVSYFGNWIDEQIRIHRSVNKCKRNEFYCPEDDFCIRRELLCNDKWDCTEGSDETACIPEVIELQFRCNSGLVIPMENVCDGLNHCGLDDNSDEQKCSILKDSNCEEGEFLCLEGEDRRCLKESFVCDGVVDCENLSDEFNCSLNDLPKAKEGPCGMDTEFHCHKTMPLQCIPIDWRCDGEVDCPFNEDEINCPNPQEINNNQVENSISENISTKMAG